jgi:hypothetical protein
MIFYGMSIKKEKDGVKEKTGEAGLFHKPLLPRKFLCFALGHSIPPLRVQPGPELFIR